MKPNWKQRLIWALADLLGVDYRRPVPTDPIDLLVTLPDDPHTVYAWVFGERATATDMKDLAEAFERVGVRKSLQAVHLFVKDVRDIREVRPDELRRILLPILEQMQEGLCRS